MTATANVDLTSMQHRLDAVIERRHITLDLAVDEALRHWVVDQETRQALEPRTVSAGDALNVYRLLREAGPVTLHPDGKFVRATHTHPLMGPVDFDRSAIDALNAVGWNP